MNSLAFSKYSAPCMTLLSFFLIHFFCLSVSAFPSLHTLRPSSELIRTADGGQISLDWVDNGASAAYPESSTRPTVLILPGLTGNSQQPYVLHAISQATRRGYRSAISHCTLACALSVCAEEIITQCLGCGYTQIICMTLDQFILTKK